MVGLSIVYQGLMRLTRVWREGFGSVWSVSVWYTGVEKFRVL